MLIFFKFLYSDPGVHALQFLDVINMKDPTQKVHFYKNTLSEALPFIPKVGIATRGRVAFTPFGSGTQSSQPNSLLCL